jgi:hypothetical protein
MPAQLSREYIEHLEDRFPYALKDQFMVIASIKSSLTSIVILIDCFYITNIVVCVSYDMNIEFIRFTQIA